MKEKKIPASVFLILFISLLYFSLLGRSLFYPDPPKRSEVFERLASFEPGRLRIGIITDIHACQGVMNDLGKFVSRIDGKSTDFNVSLGDNISFRLGNCDESFQEDLSTVVGKLRTARSPFYFVLGDHDIGSDLGSVDFWQKISKNPTNYYSFDKKNFHIIVLDTILGGEEMRPECGQEGLCRLLEDRYQKLKDLSDDQKSRKEYLETNGLKEREFSSLLREVEKYYQEELEKTKNVRSSGRRDIGRLSEKELDWLREDLANTNKDKVVVFSDHPLFHFVSPRKEYDIENGGLAREILETSGKEIVAISGEAHLWHEEELNGIRYYIVDRFSGPEESFAVFRWDGNGHRLEKRSGLER